MIFTLGWKEFREHWPIWLTMVLMTGLLAFALIQFSSRDEVSSTRLGLTVLCMAGAYGVVCGAMMFAGEREAGTLVFLDIFLGRRGLLWSMKFLIGAFFALLEGLAVAGVVYLLKEAPPQWMPALIGQKSGNVFPFSATAAPPGMWFLILPLVTVEAYAWGVLGSTLTWRVLSGAALAALIAAPFLLMLIFTPPTVYLGMRLFLAAGALLTSLAIFVNQSREPRAGPPPKRREQLHPLKRLALEWEGDKFDLEARLTGITRSAWDIPVAEPKAASHVLLRRERRPADAESPSQVLCWLAFRQAGAFLAILAGAALLVGFFIPYQGQVLWPIATLLLGVACGTATFAPEQRELSYQFLAAQHLPLKTFWNVKIVFWLAVAVLGALLLLVGGGLTILFANAGAPPGGWGADAVRFQFGTLPELMGTLLFWSVWLVYGFCTGQVLVLFCRKNVLAVLIASLVSVGAIALWLPGLLCGGMSGWQVWVPPLVMLVATRLLVRAWAGGRIRERRPLAAVIGFSVMVVAWVAANVGARTWEIRDVGVPLDRIAFRASIGTANANLGGHKIREALAEMEGEDGKEGPWLPRLAEGTRLPVGVIETPPGGGPPLTARHLPTVAKMTARLRTLAKSAQVRGNSAQAFEHLAQALALSRNLRNKAPLAGYLTGVKTEASAVRGLEAWLAHEKPAPELLRRVLDELNRHAAETPPPLDCLQTECFRATGLVENPTAWAGQAPERWLAGAIALSLEMPWEKERSLRLWRAVWAGLFRGLETPHGQLPQSPPELATQKESTRRIMQGWLPASEGPGASLTAAQLARLLDASRLADEDLFAPVVPLRAAATRARWRLDAGRLAVALALYQIDKGKPAPKLADLVPRYLPALPRDPYSGESFRYRVSAGERLVIPGDEDFQGHKGLERTRVRAGQGIVWSTGPDRVDHGGRNHGDHLRDDDPQWPGADFDLLTVVPHWP